MVSLCISVDSLQRDLTWVFFFVVNWSIVDLQCCVNFCYTAKWFIIYIYIYIYMYIFLLSSIMVYHRISNLVPCAIHQPYAHSSTIHNSQDMETPKCPSTDEWINEMWFIYTMEHYWAIKKNEIMPFAATWMDLEIIMLREVSQIEKDEFHMVSLICGIWSMAWVTYLWNRFIDIENRLVVVAGQGGEGWSGLWVYQMQTVLYRIDKPGCSLWLQKEKWGFLGEPGAAIFLYNHNVLSSISFICFQWFTFFSLCLSSLGTLWKWRWHWPGEWRSCLVWECSQILLNYDSGSLKFVWQFLA